MFQYASLKGIATYHGYEFCIPPKNIFGTFDQNVKKDGSCIYNAFDLESKNKILVTGNKILRESEFNFNSDLFNGCEDDIDLFGYFQTEKYFKHIENDIRQDFTFNNSIFSDCKQFYDDNFSDTPIISLHVRRGDYLLNPNHPVQSIDFYKKSLEKFDSSFPVLVFSDDSDWCDKQELFSDDRFFISQNNDEKFDLCLMSMCDYHIIANSSYSWWGAWLANSKKIIAPKNWFSGSCASHNTSDLDFGNWIEL